MAFSIENVKRLFKLEPGESKGENVQKDVPAEVSEGVRSAAWLAPDTLLLVIRHPSDDLALAVTSRDVGSSPDVHFWGYSTNHCLVMVSGVDDPMEAFSLTLGEHRITGQEIMKAVHDLPTLIRENLAGLKPSVREQIVAFMGSSLSWGADPHLIASIHLIRETLRERLPYCETQRDLPQGMHIDALLAIDDRSFYVKGWVWDSEATVTRVIAESPLGSRIELQDKLTWYPRTDIVKYYGGEVRDEKEPGFVGYFQTEHPGHPSDSWIFEMHNSEGTAWQKKAPTVTQDVRKVRNAILGDIDLRKPHSDEVLKKHLFPAINTLQERYRKTVEIECVDQYGKPHPAADTSIVVPLYKRIDFLEQQLAQFALDAEVQATDLIYVLDSPEMEDQLRKYARQLYRLYRIPFRIVTLNRNAGFSTANNLGASLAQGRRLLLLNSDVLPDQPGWLGSMVSFYDARPNIGALGPKLLYEDDSLQHAGMYFLRQDGEAEWENMHYFKGLHRQLPAANEARPVPAVTGACLMIDLQLYQDLGGLQGIYVQGDYEDSDLCLRLIQAGYENWYVPEVELYHLEGQSYPSSVRHRAQQYNRWLHTYLWNKDIGAIMAERVPGSFAQRMVPAEH
ncbi:MAG TPA: glycosyltransferase [Rhodothermales bacterium]|nr:glycosyltransferase [Rhodothermales bacterium]